MTVYKLNEQVAFPPVEHAEPDGLLAIGGDLGPERLLLAYQLGIFPWYDDGLPILWHAPDPRCVLVPERLHISRSLAKSIRRASFEIRLDHAFPAVIEHCARVPREDQPGTWITKEMQDAYCALFDLGFAHSVEAWQDGELVGGLYGVSIGRAFFGESMFSLKTNASKTALVWLARQLCVWGYQLIDCQVHTPHLSSLGAEMWPRSSFSLALARAVDRPTRRGCWEFDEGFTPLALPNRAPKP